MVIGVVRVIRGGCVDEGCVVETMCGVLVGEGKGKGKGELKVDAYECEHECVLV